MLFTQEDRFVDRRSAPEEPTLVLNGVPSLDSIWAPLDLPSVPGYDVVRLIDQGGMSCIYLARQKIPDRYVALKMIRPQDSFQPELCTRLINEGASIAQLEHPHIVQIHEIGEVDGVPYLSLEYVAGGNLERKLRNGLPAAHEAVEIVRQLAEAIQAAHDLQIIHRDLKPSNVLCDQCPINGDADSGCWSAALAPVNVKLADFGLARILCEPIDHVPSGFAIGTPSFMSPEQASGHLEDVRKAADVYGLGAILYELLTGQPPFSGSTASETMRLVRFAPPVPPSERNPDVAAGLEQICLRCLEKEPANRPGSARELADDLSQFLVTAYPPHTC